MAEGRRRAKESPGETQNRFKKVWERPIGQNRPRKGRERPIGGPGTQNSPTKARSGAERAQERPVGGTGAQAGGLRGEGRGAN